jgi:hypothetical protein
MIRSEYYLARAERLRMLMLTASDPASAVRLRGFVQKYRDLAEGARKQVRPPPHNPFGIEYGLSYAPRNANGSTHWQRRANKMLTVAHSRERKTLSARGLSKPEL